MKTENQCYAEAAAMIFQIAIEEDIHGAEDLAAMFERRNMVVEAAGVRVFVKMLRDTVRQRVQCMLLHGDCEGNA